MNTSRTMLAVIAVAVLSCGQLAPAAIVLEDDFEGGSNLFGLPTEAATASTVPAGASGANVAEFTVTTNDNGGGDHRVQWNGNVDLGSNNEITIKWLAGHAQDISTMGKENIKVNMGIPQVRFGDASGNTNATENFVGGIQFDDSFDDNFQQASVTLAVPAGSSTLVEIDWRYNVRFADPNTTFIGYGDLFQVDAVPEPASLTLLGLGGLAMVARRRR